MINHKTKKLALQNIVFKISQPLNLIASTQNHFSGGMCVLLVLASAKQQKTGAFWLVLTDP